MAGIGEVKSIREFSLVPFSPFSRAIKTKTYGGGLFKSVKSGFLLHDNVYVSLKTELTTVLSVR